MTITMIMIAVTIIIKTKIIVTHCDNTNDEKDLLILPS